jgi:hypothetical protein
MATDVRSMVLGLAILMLILAGVYLIDPTFFGMYKFEGFQAMPGSDTNASESAGQNETPGENKKKATESNMQSAGGDSTTAMAPTTGGSTTESFANYDDESGPADFGSATGPAGCYPRDQLTPGELLPKDQNSIWAQQNPMGTGSLKGKNFLSAGALIGVNTVGQTLRNANYQLRSEPPNPQVPVSVFNNSTIEPDTNRRDFEVS